MSNTFALSLYEKLRGAGNFVYCPTSLRSTLLRAALGANGPTRDEMLGVLDVANDDSTIAEQLFAAERLLGSSGSVTLTLANAIYAQDGYGFLPGYINLFKDWNNFHRVDFTRDPDGIRRQANTWVSVMTDWLIRDLLPEGAIKSDVRLLILNAVYLNAAWLRPFPKARTVRGNFFPVPAMPITADLMQQVNDFPAMRGTDVKVLQMPYVGNEFSMLVILPGEGVSLWDVESDIILNGIDQYLRHLRTNKVILTYPKHKLKWGTFEVSQALQQLGMRLAFNSAQADFTRMAEKRELYLSRVFHQAAMEVDETKTVAAAGSGASMAKEATQRTPFVFDAIRPFMGIIRHNLTGEFLFMSRVVTPMAS